MKYKKFIFSRRPSSPSNDFEVAAVFEYEYIAFWRPGQQQWIIESNTNSKFIHDVCFYRGEFYSICSNSLVIAFGNQTSKQPRIVADLVSQGLENYRCYAFYIVVLQDTLLVVQQKMSLDNSLFWTPSFELFEVDVDNGKTKQVESIGDRALFVGHNSTFFVEACSSDKRGCRPNCIYFTEDDFESYLGIFCLKEKRVVGEFYQGHSHFKYEPPPLWVQLP
ncbi:hypothetical protein RDABS01_027640 [Bienertia sinuspersici]